MEKMKNTFANLHSLIIFFCFFKKNFIKVLDNIVNIHIINQSININSILIPFWAEAWWELECMVAEIFLGVEVPRGDNCGLFAF